MEENMLENSMLMPFVMDNAPTTELFLLQYTTDSQQLHGYTLYKRLIMHTDWDLIKYNCKDAMTRDFYKDKQHQDVYSLLDKVVLYNKVNMDVVNNLKVFLNKARNKMYRVDKLEVGLTALFLLCSAVS